MYGVKRYDANPTIEENHSYRIHSSVSTTLPTIFILRQHEDTRCVLFLFFKLVKQFCR